MYSVQRDNAAYYVKISFIADQIQKLAERIQDDTRLRAMVEP